MSGNSLSGLFYHSEMKVEECYCTVQSLDNIRVYYSHDDAVLQYF